MIAQIIPNGILANIIAIVINILFQYSFVLNSQNRGINNIRQLKTSAKKDKNSQPIRFHRVEKPSTLVK
jgi:hypothetical protein